MKTVTALTLGVALLSVFSFLFLGESAALVHSRTEIAQPTPPSNKVTKKIVSAVPACSPQRTPSTANNPDKELDSYDVVGTGDYDCDGICNIADNCMSIYNPDQADADGDGKGDACIIQKTNPNFVDSRCDGDGDGVPDFEDNCPSFCNPSQTMIDRNKNGVNDACDGFSRSFVRNGRSCKKRLEVKPPSIPIPTTKD